MFVNFDYIKKYYVILFIIFDFIKHLIHYGLSGEITLFCNAEGATTQETLRQKGP